MSSVRPMTIAEKILGAHAGRDSVTPGEIIMVRPDVMLANDITGPVAIKEFRKIGVERVADPSKVVLVPDHFLPAKDIASAEQAKEMREFAAEQGVENYFEVGRMGIEHVLMVEEGLVVPGDVVIGADSHTTTYGALGAFATGVGSTDLAAAMAMGEIWMKVPPTIRFVYSGTPSPWVTGKDVILFTIGRIGVDGARYKVMEYAGPVIEAMSVEGRLSISNMAIEAGAKAGIIAADAATTDYMRERVRREPIVVENDPDADFEAIHDFDLSGMEPQVAFPHLPSNTKPVSEARTVKIDQVVIGSCTNGRIEDLRVAAGLMHGRKVADGLRTIIIPGSQAVYLQAMKEGLLETFINFGAAVSTPTCGPCLGGHMGILARGERAVATTNRNFRGRMGHPESEVYLASPAVAAASAAVGSIASPEDL